LNSGDFVVIYILLLKTNLSGAVHTGGEKSIR